MFVEGFIGLRGGSGEAKVLRRFWVLLGVRLLLFGRSRWCQARDGHRYRGRCAAIRVLGYFGATRVAGGWVV